MRARRGTTKLAPLENIAQRIVADLDLPRLAAGAARLNIISANVAQGGPWYASFREHV